jgi:hypothetical protein
MIAAFFKHGSNSALVIAAILIGIGALTGHAMLSAGFVALGAILFYLSEYGWHRFVFHARPSRFAFVRRLQHRLHYDHHAEPNRLDLLFLPLWFLIPNLTVTAGFLGLVFGGARVPSLLLGVILAILHYEIVHYIAHISYEPRTRFGRWMKRYHLRHHFINETQWFGVSNPSLDFVAGTWADVRTIDKTQTTRQLYR